jgi:phospholipid/cholesterol/gamma-HCH transport system permease protein
MTDSPFLEFDLSSMQLTCQGQWTLANYAVLQNQLAQPAWPESATIHINGQAISKMDTAGAWLLIKLSRYLESQNIHFDFQNMGVQFQRLLTYVDSKMPASTAVPELTTLEWLARVGKTALNQLSEFLKFLNFTGKLATESLRAIVGSSRLRWNSITDVIDKTGFQALGIIALLSFMIGVVIAYQMGFQLRNYGANVFIVNLLGLSVLREFGPLLTAIMVAGRTGSAFTAQLGIMKLNQEMDALNSMGITPSELLIFPRIVGLFIALPLLTIWADIFGIMGGMLMANNMLNVTFYDFLDRFQREIPLRSLVIGLGKAPVFALIIASIGCFQGMQVTGSAESVGAKTTKSVVLAIFTIIVADAIFSIIFSKLRL